MADYRCFHDDIDAALLDRAHFRCTHRLAGESALTLERLREIIPALPPEQVMYSVRPLANGDNFEGEFKRRPSERSLDETLALLPVSDSYVMVNSPHVHPAFAPLREALMEDVGRLMQRRGVGSEPLSPKLFLFIASPGSVTPFHIDRYSTLLLQFRGTKTVTVFDPWDPRVVSPEATEAYMTYQNTKLHWDEGMNGLGTAYDFHPGEALHIPFAAGHHVRNGTGDISISMSIIFNTPESMRWREALAFNQWFRPKLGKVGLGLNPVGSAPARDRAKAAGWSALSKVRSLVRPD